MLFNGSLVCWVLPYIKPETSRAEKGSKSKIERVCFTQALGIGNTSSGCHFDSINTEVHV